MDAPGPTVDAAPLPAPPPPAAEDVDPTLPPPAVEDVDPAPPPPAAEDVAPGPSRAAGNAPALPAMEDNVVPPPPKKKKKRRVMPLRDEDIAINQEILKRNIREGQDNERLEDLPDGFTDHLMKVQKKFAVDPLERAPGRLHALGSKIKPYFYDNLVTSQLPDEGDEEPEEEEQREREELDLIQGDQPLLSDST